MAGQRYKGFDRKKCNLHDLMHFPTWMAGGGGCLNTGCQDKIISTHEIKLVLTGEMVKKTALFWP